MSYEIVYNKQFLKIDGKIIPLILHGSNNCYEILSDGRQRRKREWSTIYIGGSNRSIVSTEAEIMKEIKSCCDGGEYQEHFVQNRKWVNDKGLIRFFQNGIKNAKTIEELKSKPGARQRYAAMKKYFSYVKNNNKALKEPCIIDFDGEKYTSFVNGYSIALTKESSGEMELFGDSDNYLHVEKLVVFDGEEKEIDFNTIIAEAKGKGYKLKKSEVEQHGDFKYIFHYDNAYFKVGLLDSTYSIINDGEKATVWHPGSKKKSSPIIIKNDIGICVVCPFNYNIEKRDVTIIEVA